MHVIVQMDMAYKVTNKKYKQLLLHISKGMDIDITTYGKELGKVICITDMPQFEAAELLLDVERYEGK